MRPSILLLTLASCALAGDDIVADRGFRITPPGAPWRCAEVPAPAETFYAWKAARGEGAAEASVTIYLADAEGYSDAKTACDLAEMRWKADPHASGVTRSKGPLAGTEAPALRFTYALGARYVVRQQYLVREGTLYALQSAAPEAEFEKDLPELDAIVGTFAFVPIADPKRHATDALVRRLAKRCGSEVPWAKDWNEASARARKEDKLVVVVIEQYSGLLTQRYAPSTLFMDTDVVELMRERFVGLQWSQGMQAPLVSPDVYGLGPGTFGMGALFCDADGKVVGEAVSFNPFYFYRRLIDVLATRPDAPQKDVQALLRRGDLAEAWTRLKRPKSAEEWRLQADLLRRMRLGQEALDAIRNARKAGGEVDLAEAIIRLRLGQFDGAETLLEGRAEPEARYWRACARAMRTGIGGVREELEKLANDHPDDRWAWRGAAMLCGLGLMTGIDRVDWPDEKSLGLADLPESGRIENPVRAKEGAVKFLLGAQLQNGSWSSPVGLSDLQESVPLAVTSVCGMALLPHRDRADVKEALGRAIRFVELGTFGTGGYRLFDYNIWAQIFSLRFLACCAKEGLGERRLLHEVMTRIVGDMRQGQRPGGGWAYVRFDPSGHAEDNSISFVTAAAVLALVEAKEAGVQVPEETLQKAIGALASLARPGGTFGYMTLLGAGTDDLATEASLRSPLCALALVRAGKGDVEGVRKALRVYLAHHAHARRERGKVLCHTSPEGIASYYLLYGCMFSAEALRELPADEREEYRAALLDDVLSMRCADGSFCDNPMIGRCYGTGAALRSLSLLQGGGRK